MLKVIDLGLSDEALDLDRDLLALLLGSQELLCSKIDEEIPSSPSQLERIVSDPSGYPQASSFTKASSTESG